MKHITIERQKLEKKIKDSHNNAQSEATQWMLRHPFTGIAAFISMMKKGEVSDKVAKQWQNLPSWKEYQEAYKQLEILEEKEGYPAMNFYAEQLDQNKNRISSKKAYYPFAGTDFYWARIFDEIVFEDIGYGQEYVKNMWWTPDKYQDESINDIINKLRSINIITNGVKIDLIQGNANQTREDNDCNNEDYTLIVKGGHSVINFLNKRFGEEKLNFNSAIFVSATDSNEKLEEEMNKRGYRFMNFDVGERFYSPYAMGLYNICVFDKR
ncbi:hypothetical protein ACFL1H_07235 [Nanoarchaeota archaeon]